MVRSLTVLMFALILSPSPSFAQAVVLTVNGTGTSVYRSPSNASPVVGQAARGTSLEVTREVGDWVKVTWPSAPDKVGYVRRNAGVIGAPGAAVAATPAAKPVAAAARPAATSATRSTAAARPAASAPARNSTPAPAAAPVMPTPPTVAQTPVASPEPAASPVMASASQSAGQLEPTNIRPQAAPGYVSSPSHKLGVGLLAGGPAMGLGFSARKWSAGRLGLQLDFLRTSTSEVPFVTNMTSLQAGPRVLYSLNDRVSDYTWVRPYLGAGTRYYRSSLADPGLGTTQTDSRVGAQVFGGAELSFSSAPRFGISVDVGYDWFTSPFPGYALDGVALTVGGRWYVR